MNITVKIQHIAAKVAEPRVDAPAAPTSAKQTNRDARHASDQEKVLDAGLSDVIWKNVTGIDSPLI